MREFADKGGSGSKNPKILRTSYVYRPLQYITYTSTTFFGSCDPCFPHCHLNISTFCLQTEGHLLTPLRPSSLLRADVVYGIPLGPLPGFKCVSSSSEQDDMRALSSCPHPSLLHNDMRWLPRSNGHARMASICCQVQCNNTCNNARAKRVRIGFSNRVWRDQLRGYREGCPRGRS